VSTPYERAFDLTGLDQQLAAYFTSGRLGRGEGTFDVVGTPRRWLWPVLWVLGRQGVVFPHWGAARFTVTNRPVDAALTAVRTFHFDSGDRSMVDRMSVEGGELYDELGINRRYRARLAARVADGALELWSTAVTMRLGPLHLPLPARVALTERWDAASDRQHVSVVITAPVIGRVYEYSGFFTYRVDS